MPGRHGASRFMPWPDRLALLAIMGWAIVVVRPLFDPGYPSSWDGDSHFARLKVMADLFLPRGRTDGWCPYWYNGSVLFLFYPKLFFLLAGGAFLAMGGLVPLLLVFKLFVASAYLLLPPAMYIMARCYRFTRFAALCAALCTLAVSAPHGIGPEGLFAMGLIPHGFALPLLALALGTFHLGVTLGGRFLPIAALLSAMLIETHFISGVYLALACNLYLVIACWMDRRPRRTIRRALTIGLLTAGVCAATLIPLVVHSSLRGPGTLWLDFGFFGPFLRGGYLGGWLINWLALGFVLTVRWKRFEEVFLAILSALTFALAAGVIRTWIPEIDHFLWQTLKTRGFAFLGLLVALFAGGTCSAIRRFVERRTAVLSDHETHKWGVRRWQSALVPLALVGFLLLDVAMKLDGLRPLVRVDAHYHTAEKSHYLDAYRWLRENAPRPAVIGFDTRLKEFGNPGYKQMASRIVLEADRFSLQGIQIEATRGHNAEVLRHLHDWEPKRIHRALLRYNVSFLLTWTADVEANLGTSPDFALVHRNVKAQVWEVRGHDFRFVEGEGLQVGTLDFRPERITWVLTNHGTRRPVALAVSYHPYWRAWLNGAPIPIRETEDQLMEVQIPPGTSTLILEFRRAWWEILTAAVSLASLGLSLWLWLRGRRRSPGRSLGRGTRNENAGCWRREW
jgi:hypothetical protein